MHTHGSAYQAGFPDMYVTHKVYSARWVEVKLPEMKGSRYTPAQLITFPRLCAHGAGVWVLTAASEKEYAKLFKAYNWSMYLL